MFPTTIDEFRNEAVKCGQELSAIKTKIQVPDYGWYPYTTLGAVPIISELLDGHFEQLREAALADGVADIGCGDGDLGFLFSKLGCRVDALDYADTNFNQMRGVRTLAACDSSRLVPHEVNLDGFFHLPKPAYGLSLFLGTLYHLKNPFLVLETIAAHASWCLLSTRIAQQTPVKQTRIEHEQVAYLLKSRQANNDPTNLWIFSPSGLDVLLERTGWAVLSSKRVGCTQNSDPSSPDADERIYLLLRSKKKHPDLYIRPLAGWHNPEDGAFRWTAKEFSLAASYSESAHEFALRVFVPPPVLTAGPVRLACHIDGQPVGRLTCTSPEPIEFRGRFPTGNNHQLHFAVESHFTSGQDARELGVCVPLDKPNPANGHGIPFRIS